MPINFDYKGGTPEGLELPPKPMKMSGRERLLTQHLMLLQSSIVDNGKYIEARFRSMKNGWRDWRLFQSLLRKIVNQLYYSGERVDKEAMYLVNKSGKFNIDCSGRAINEAKLMGYTYVKGEDMKKISLIAIRDQCLMCDREGKDINRCPLRNAMQTVWNPPEVNSFSQCEYQMIAMADREALKQEVRDI